MFERLYGFNDDLLGTFRQLEQELDQLLGASPWPSGIRAVARGSFPPVNIGVTPEQVDVYLFAAGLNPEGLEITLQQNLLTVAGERKLSPREDANYFRQERFDGAFRRVLTLPEDVDPDKVEASYKDGILHITIKRRETAKPRRIQVQ